MEKFKFALVRKPTESMIAGISSAKLGKPDFAKALEQHQAYCEAMKECGLDIIEIESLTQFPDAVFVEDTAIVTERFAVISKPGHENRKGEEKSVANKLIEYRPLEFIESPGLLDGGDIMRVGDHFYIGLSDRTNIEGARQLTSHLKKYDYSASMVEIGEMLHLKTGINYVGSQKMVMVDGLHSMKEFEKFEKIIIPENESYAANCVLVNDYLLIAKGFKTAKDKFLKKAGFKIIELDMSEFRKLDGGLSCLSLRF